MRDFLNNQWQKVRNYPVIVVFFALLIGFTLIDLIVPDRESSELENKNLAQRPSFNLSTLLRNEWTAKYDQYVKEQVFGRDTWITLYSRAETALLRKTDIGGMTIGEDGQLFTKMPALTESEQKQLPKNIEAVTQFAARYPGKVTFMMAPSASLVHADRLPYATPILDEGALTDEIFAQVGQTANVLDLRPLFAEHREDDEELYYFTDHHWTTYGAYLAYTAFCEQQGLTPFDPESHSAIDVPKFYGTSYSASRYYGTLPDTLTYYDLPNRMTVYEHNAMTNEFIDKGTTGLYDLAKLDTRDKYAAFLYGNNGYSVIEGDGKGSILVIKDSYANCFIPFLTANYETIGVVDLRNFKSINADELIEQGGYDHVLVLYNFQSFKSDGFLVYLNRYAGK